LFRNSPKLPFPGPKPVFFGSNGKKINTKQVVFIYVNISLIKIFTSF